MAATIFVDFFRRLRVPAPLTVSRSLPGQSTPRNSSPPPFDAVERSGPNIAADSSAVATGLNEAASLIKAAYHNRHRRHDAAAAVTACWAAGAAVEDLGRHDRELWYIRDLVQIIRFDEDLHTPPVANALGLLRTCVADKLLPVLREDSCSLEQLAIAMSEVKRAVRDLRNWLPILQLRQEQQLEGSVCINSDIGGNADCERIIISAQRNEASNGFQVNAPMRGDASFLAAMIAAFAPSGTHRS